MNSAYEAIVIGAGHNGLVTAAYLARAGLRVLVLERRGLVGGAAVTEEIYPGFKFDTCAHRIGSLHPAVVKDLQPARHGAEILQTDPTVFSPLPDGRHLLLWRNPQDSCEAIRRFSEADANRWIPFCGHVGRAAGFLESLYHKAPPNVIARDAATLWTLLKLGGRLRRMGKRDMMEVMRTLPMSVAEFLGDWFETDVLKGTLGAIGISGICQGPLAFGTAFLMLHHQVGSNNGVPRSTEVVRGGVGNLTQALAAAARKWGVEIRTDAEVQRVTVEDNRATGVVLASGDEIAARWIVSNADPRRTFLKLVDPIDLDPQFLREVHNIKFRGACAKVHLALDELPSFTCAPGNGPHLHGVISISPSLHYLEHAYDDAKHGGISRQPYLEILIPSLIDPTMAPPGKHVMSIFAQYAPYHLKEGVWDDARREALGDAVVETLAQYAPNLEAAILHRHVLTPLDLETAYGLTEGNINHGELTLDQLFFMRPVPGWAQYRTPIQNLFLCGAGTHPGGGVTGAPGYNAARQILRDVKRDGSHRER